MLMNGQLKFKGNKEFLHHWRVSRDLNFSALKWTTVGRVRGASMHKTTQVSRSRIRNAQVCIKQGLQSQGETGKRF